MYLGLISPEILTLQPYIGLIWCYFDTTSKLSEETYFQYQETYMLDIIVINCLKKVKVRSSKPLAIKLKVEVKVVSNLNRA